jgi:uncharacterized damage-inducible protein DinB
MAQALELVLRHNAWANRALLEFCSGLDRVALDRGTPGTYGTLLSTIQHIVSGEQWYLELLSGEAIGMPVDEKVPRPLAELQEIASRTGARAIELASTDDADRPIIVDGKEWTAGVIYAQIVHHGNEHRSQVKSILGANGIEPPGVSAWGYAMDAGLIASET